MTRIFKNGTVDEAQLRKEAPTLLSYFSEQDILKKILKSEEWAKELKQKEIEINEKITQIKTNADSLAQEEAEEIKLKYQEEGIKIGKELVLNEYNKVDKLIKDLQSELLSKIEKTEEVLAEELTDVAIFIAEKIVRERLKLSSDALVNFVKSIFKEIKAKGKVRLSLSRDIYQVLVDKKAQLIPGGSDVTEIDFLKTETENELQMKIEFDWSTIEASVETQFKQIRKALA